MASVDNNSHNPLRVSELSAAQQDLVWAQGYRTEKSKGQTKHDRLIHILGNRKIAVNKMGVFFGRVTLHVLLFCLRFLIKHMIDLIIPKECKCFYNQI